MKARAQDILIIRPLSNNKSEVETETIQFEVEISAFAPIVEVKINGRKQPVPNNTWVTIGVPLRLRRGENRIIVDATTEFETATKEFVINLKYKREPGEEEVEPGGFQLISILGVQNSSNPLSLPESNPLNLPDGGPPIAGQKTFLILIPSYDWNLLENSTIQFQSIISRETYDKTELASVEIAFTQVLASWVQTFDEQSFWKAGIGFNFIDGKDPTLKEDDTLFFGELRWILGASNFLAFGLEVLNRDLSLDAEEPDLEGDATVTTFRGGFESRFSSSQLLLNAELAETDAIGKFKDDTTTRFSVTYNHILGDFILSPKLRITQQDFKEAPAPEAPASSKKNSIFFTVNYLLSEAWIIQGEYLTESQDSNNPLLKFDNTAVSAALIYIF